MNIEFISSIVKLLRPKYYNTLTRILIVGGLALLSKPIWVDILNLFLGGFKLSIIGEFDWLLGLVVIVLALMYNTIHRYMDYKFEGQKKPAYDKVEYKIFREFGELCQEILPLLNDNEYIFKTTGPNSGVNNLEALREDLALWEKLKVEAILPNNNAIKKLIIENKSIVPNIYSEVFNKMVIHIEAFNEHIINPNFDYSNFRFPSEFPNIILTTSFQFASSNKKLSKKLKWISARLNNNQIINWFIFGSTVFTPDKANDLDIAILVNKSPHNIHIFNQEVSKLKFDFKIKFRQNLHVSIFDNEHKNDYSLFSDRNPLKIENKNG